ncbi:helix-turn-helix domain-containing protein [Chryseobacterium sp. G0201]|nr:helix-turn-helix domain-containing protein [Chryseobacterium sp. G0201]
MKNNPPDYKKIYCDLISIKYPEKTHLFKHLLSKTKLSTLDVMEFSTLLSKMGTEDTLKFNQQHRSYNKSAIYQILEYQKINKINNSQLAEHFNLSRNTVAKWKKKFIITV